MEKKIIAYTVLRNSNYDEFQKAANELFASEWQPYGGVSTSPLPSNNLSPSQGGLIPPIHYAQAWVRYEK